MLKLADNLSLPTDAVTQSIAILAKRRAGKSYTARRFTEELIRARLQCVIVDPKGDWWGIRHAADGMNPGLPVIVLGGEHGDLPLEVNAGEIIAKLAVEERVSLLLDLSSFRKNEVATFMTGFLENFYRLKAQEQYRTPVMLIVDEADAIAPQKPYKGEERMLGAIEDIVRRGGQRGIGCLLITQRSAVLNKNVLTQTQVLVAMRTIAPQDLAAMGEWINVHGTAEERKILMDSLPSLPTGDAWFWSPGWPSEGGIFRNVHILPISTFDSGATPKPGEKRIEPKNPADVDLAALSRKMAATIEKKKADDPRELRKRIAELERQVKTAKQAPAPVDTGAIEAAYKRGFNDGRKKTATAIAELVALGRRAEKTLSILDSEVKSFTSGAAMYQLLLEKEYGAPAIDVSSVPTPAKTPLRSSPPERPMPAGDKKPAGGLRRMLIALAQWNRPLSAKQLGVRAGMSSKSGTFGTYLAKARSSGWIDGSRDRLSITGAGVEELGSFEPLPTGRGLLQYWLGELGGGAARMLEVLASDPQSVPADTLGEAAGISPKSGTFGTYLARLRTLELIHGGRDALRASEDLFE